MHDTGTVQKAVARSATATWQRSWPDVWFRAIMGNRLPGPVEEEDRLAAVDVPTLAPGRPLELLGAVSPPDRPSTDAWLRAMQQRGVPCRPMPGLQRGGGHTTACAASVPGAGGETPAAPRHNKPGGD